MSSVAILYGIIVLTLAGCTGRSHNAKNSQVVAMVNDQEITVSQLNQSLQSVDPTAVAPDVTKHAIDSLVSEELLVEGALKHRLDRDPVVMQAVDAARRQVLARYFAERDLYPKKSITKREAEEFYKNNPILFANRKRFQLKNFTVSTIDLNDRLQTELDQAHSAAEIRDVLDKHDVKYSAQVTALTADQLPVDKLADFSRASAGDVMMAQQGNGTSLLMFITAIEDDNPMSFDRARPYIEVYLANLRNGEAIAEYLKQEKAIAKIDYPPTGDAAKFRPARLAIERDAVGPARSRSREEIARLAVIATYAAH